MDSYVRLLRKTSTDKLLFIIDKIMVKLSIIIVIISNNYPYNMDKVWIPMSALRKILPINYCLLSINGEIIDNYRIKLDSMSAYYG